MLVLVVTWVQVSAVLFSIKICHPLPLHLVATDGLSVFTESPSRIQCSASSTVKSTFSTSVRMIDGDSAGDLVHPSWTRSFQVALDAWKLQFPTAHQPKCLDPQLGEKLGALLTQMKKSDPRQETVRHWEINTKYCTNPPVQIPADNPETQTGTGQKEEHGFSGESPREISLDTRVWGKILDSSWIPRGKEKKMILSENDVPDFQLSSVAFPVVRSVPVCLALAFQDATLILAIQMQFREDPPNVNGLTECITS
ncbi:hypothetical protein MJG53_002870 [Ovis ammon polii x Ovis aries]|uniref:Uncharacterized protein n=1 Tax=Ovis ammon polii x Ovis aries TaxID=2918886 RepID=A0ACB9VFB3_9CETA|nr:hypothetical protein MJT46_004208 [Ovis ammon polii x Ovis aries]KAI4588462.1 hypothetical protein MJG53_002870 [Ovis ammon polii x Ovis aries]